MPVERAADQAAPFRIEPPRGGGTKLICEDGSETVPPWVS